MLFTQHVRLDSDGAHMLLCLLCQEAVAAGVAASTTAAPPASVTTTACRMESAARTLNRCAPRVRPSPSDAPSAPEIPTRPPDPRPGSVSARVVAAVLCSCATEKSCKGRCGESFRRGRLCSCDADCSKYRQCCSDHALHCGAQGGHAVWGRESVCVSVSVCECECVSVSV